MTPEEAIKTIQVAVAEVEWNYPMDYSVAFETAIEALKSQIPKKVKYHYIEGRLVNYHCPSCGEAQGLKVNKRWQKFCPHCGQALDWRETENDT